MNTRKVIFVVVALSLFVGRGHADSTLHDVSDLRLLKAACPTNWKSIDKAIPSAGTNPIPPTVITWQDSVDQDDFMLFQKNFIIASTKNNQTTETKAADPLLVARECIKRHNPVLNAYMGKEIGEEPVLRKLMSWIPAVLNILWENN